MMHYSFETLQRIHDAIAIIESGKIDSYEVGHHDLAEHISVNVMEYETKETGIFESHHKYIDIHYLISGIEEIETADEENIVVTEQYNDEGDYVLGKGEGKKYRINEKHFFVVMPGEAHLPGLLIDKPEKVKKAVVKVRVA